MLRKVHETRTVHVRCIHKKIVTTLERSVKGYGGGGSGRAKRRIGGLGPRAVVWGLNLFLPPKNNLF